MLGGTLPIVAATDYVRSYPQLIAPYLSGRFVALGTDGFGRSDTRAALRSFFEVDRRHVAVAALHELARAGTIASATVADAIARYGIDPDVAASWTV
jgi:pyruvate dehydrogenase E1 component